MKRLDSVMLVPDAVDVGWLTDRSIYNEVAWQWLSIFDLNTKLAHDIQDDLIPIVRFIENDAAAA